jgi:translation elongation factor EF-Tu-like GTPase
MPRTSHDGDARSPDATVMPKDSTTRPLNPSKATEQRTRPSNRWIEAKRNRQTVRVDEKLRFEIRDCFTITGRSTVVTGDIVSGVAQVNDVVDLVHNGWTIRTKIIGTEMGHGPDGMPFHFVGLMLAGVRRFDVVPGDHVSGLRRDS